MAFANDPHSQFIDSYFKGLANAQDEANLAERKRQFDATQMQEAQRIAIEQQNSQNTALYQKALAANMQAEAAQRQRQNALGESQAGIQFQPPTSPQDVQTSAAAPLAGGQGVYAQTTPPSAPTSAVPSFTPQGPVAPSQTSLNVGPGDQATANARSAALVPAQTTTLSPDQVLASQHMQRIAGYPAPPGQEAVMPDLQGQIQRAQMVKRAGEIPTPEYLKDVWSQDTIDPALLEKLAVAKIGAGKASASSLDAAAQASLSKMAQAGEITTPEQLTDVGAFTKAVRGSKVLGEQEKGDLIAHVGMKTNPIEQATAGAIRMAALNAGRPVAVMDTTTGNMRFVSGQTANSNPQFAPEAAAERVAQTNARYNNIHNNIDSMETAVKNMGTLDAGARAQMAYAMKTNDPANALQQFAQGAVVSNLPEPQREYIQSLAVLAEDVQNLSKMAGAGSGAQDLREKVGALIPALVTDPKYAVAQLEKLRAVVDTLRKAVPGAGAFGRGEVNSNPAATTNQPSPANTIHWGRDAQGNPIPLPQGK